MRFRAVQAGLWALAVLGTLAIGGSSANADELLVNMCYVSKDKPDKERNVKVPKRAAEEMLRNTLSYRGVCASYGESASLGNGQLQTYAQFRGHTPDSIGVVFSASTLDGLPYEPPTMGKWCYDKDGNGETDQHTECVGGYENAMAFSDKFRSKVDTPFQYLLMNWNPMGHPPPHVYAKPHFDVHFYMNPNEERLAIKPGPCEVLVSCEDHKKGMKPLKPKYVPKDYSYTEAIEPGMGNHMMDMTGDEFNGGEFTHSFIYGHFDGKMTFYEPMVTLKYFQEVASGTAPSKCFAMKLPKAWEVSGWYPTEYCMRYRANRDEITTSLESFVYRKKS